MATLASRLSDLAQLMGTDVKTLTAKIGNLATLSTASKTSLVAAINEVYGLIGTGGGSAVIDDTATTATDKTWSANHITAKLVEFREALLGGVPATAFDTLKEIADYIGQDQTATSGLVAAMAVRVSVADVQSFTNPQKIQGRANIGAYGVEEIGNPDTDLVTIYNTAKA